jgi:hypothetical protein
VEAFDPSNGHWETLPRMQLAHHGFAAGFIGDTFHVVGGGFQFDGMPGVNTKTAVLEVLQFGCNWASDSGVFTPAMRGAALWNRNGWWF